MKKLPILLILFMFAVPAYTATIYKWVDKDGVVNLTDSYDKVPPPYRDKVEVETRKDLQEDRDSSPTQAITPSGKEEESRTDIYGRDEAWWHEKVLPWKERLKEATEKYDAAQKKFMEKSDELSQRRFGSRTQYKMTIIELDKIGEEKKKYEAQIAEANEMLEKLSKEAEESKANPDWLK